MGNIKIDNSEIAGNYTIVYNAIFYDSELSPEAQGVYCKLCSLPPWQHISIEFLCAGCDCGANKMGRILKDLTAHGYITRTHDQDPETGAFTGYTYTLHKDPKGLLGEVTETAPETEPASETAEKKPKKKKERAVKHKHGEYGRVMLTDKEYEDLVAEYGVDTTEAAIKKVDEYCARNGREYKSFKAAIKSWGIEAATETKRGAYAPAKAKTANPFMEMLTGGI